MKKHDRLTAFGEPPPFVHFYPSRWLNSQKINCMTPAEEGAYIRLLCAAWASPGCDLPDDDEKLAIMSRLGEGWLNGSGTKIRECFVPHPKKPGRLHNELLTSDRQRAEKWRDKCRKGGESSGRTRNKAAKGSSKGSSNGSSRVDEASPSPSPSPIPSSSSPLPIPEESKTRGGESPPPPPLASPSKAWREVMNKIRDEYSKTPFSNTIILDTVKMLGGMRKLREDKKPVVLMEQFKKNYIELVAEYQKAPTS